MKKSIDIRTGRHCVFNLHVHLVFVTKYRKNIIQPYMIDRLKSILERVCTKFEANLDELNGEKEHIHLLLSYPPKNSISKMVNSLKGVSSRLLKKKFPEIRKFYHKNSLWSPSYFATSCGEDPISKIRKYIEQQKTPY